MADIERILPDGSIGLFSESQSQEEQDAIIEENFPNYKVLPDGSYGLFDENQSDEEILDLIRKDFPNYKVNPVIEAGDGNLLQVFLNGLSSNLGSEAYGSIMAALDIADNPNLNFNKLYDQYRSEFNTQIKNYYRKNPKAATAGEITGAIVGLPLAATKLAKVLPYLPKVWKSLPRSIKATLAGGLSGGAWGLGEDETRIESGKSGFLWGLAAGSISYGVLNKASQFWFNRAKKAPSLQSYKRAYNELYKEVDDQLGKVYNAADLTDAVSLAKAKLQSNLSRSYDPKLDKYTASKIAELNKRIQNGESFSLSEMDKLRQSVYSRYKESGEDALLEVAEAIDEVIMSKSAEGTLLSSAREAFKQYKRAEVIEIALEKAKKKGGDVVENYKDAIQTILNNPNTQKNFTIQQREAMQTFLNTKLGKFWNKQLAKYTPDTNNFMKFMHFFSAMNNPGTLALTAATIQASKAERMAAEKGAKKIKESIDPNLMEAPLPDLSTAGMMTGSAAVSQEDQLEKARERYIPGLPF